MEMEHSVLSTLTDLISNSKVVSFDFFDTLFWRPLGDPEDIFDLVGARFGMANFRELRKQAQVRAFERMHELGRKEISLQDIYDCFPGESVDVEALRDAELDFELKLTLPNAEMIDIFKKSIATKVTIVISDMYFGVDFFRTLLEKEDLYPHKIFVSADRNATKRDSGELFECVISELEVEAGDILHIGDSLRSDVTQASRKGLKTFLYKEPQHLERRLAHPVSASLASNLHRAFNIEEASQLYQLGFLHGGPVLYSFLEYVAEQAKADEIDKLLFVSRDGFLLHQVASSDVQRFPRIEYLKGSRVSYMLAATDHLNFEENLPFFADGATGLSPYELFERIGITPPDMAVMQDIGFPDGEIFSHSDLDRIKALLRAFKWEVLAKCGECRRGLFVYLNEMGIRSGMKIALVDVGWSGTTLDAFQKAISRLLSVDLFGYFLCLIDTPTVRERGLRLNMKSMLGPDNCSESLLAKIYENRVAVELMFSAPHNTVIGYRMSVGGKPDIIEDPGRGSIQNAGEASSALGEGMVFYYVCLKDLCREIGFHPNYREMLPLFAAFVSNLTDSQRELFANVYNFDAWASTNNTEFRASEYLSSGANS